jgi:hypothetical protein
MEKSYVTMQVCPICQDTDNPMGILMDRRLKDTFEGRYTVIPTSVCDKCKKTYLKKGIMLINPQSGKLVVIKDRAFRKVFPGKPYPKHRICFADDELIVKLVS